MKNSIDGKKDRRVTCGLSKKIWESILHMFISYQPGNGYRNKYLILISYYLIHYRQIVHIIFTVLTNFTLELPVSHFFLPTSLLSSGQLWRAALPATQPPAIDSLIHSSYCHLISFFCHPHIIWQLKLKHITMPAVTKSIANYYISNCYYGISYCHLQ